MAMKVFNKKHLMMKKSKNKRKYFYDIIREANSVRRVCDHPNIVHLHDLLETPEQLLILLECVPGGQLYDAILARKDRGYFSERMAGKVHREPPRCP
jgi:serine/threonine protein kinase